jgi:hypothetical protein
VCVGHRDCVVTRLVVSVSVNLHVEIGLLTQGACVPLR